MYKVGSPAVKHLIYCYIIEEELFFFSKLYFESSVQSIIYLLCLLIHFLRIGPTPYPGSNVCVSWWISFLFIFSNTCLKYQFWGFQPLRCSILKLLSELRKSSFFFFFYQQQTCSVLLPPPFCPSWKCHILLPLNLIRNYFRSRWIELTFCDWGGYSDFKWNIKHI